MRERRLAFLGHGHDRRVERFGIPLVDREESQYTLGERGFEVVKPGETSRLVGQLRRLW